MRILCVIALSVAVLAGCAGAPDDPDQPPPWSSDEVQQHADDWLRRLDGAVTDDQVIAVGLEYLATVGADRRDQLAAYDDGLASLVIGKRLGYRLGQAGRFDEAVRIYQQLAREAPAVAGEARYRAILQRHGQVDSEGMIGDTVDRDVLRGELVALLADIDRDDPYRVHLIYKIGFLSYLAGDYLDFVQRTSPIVYGGLPGGRAFVDSYRELDETILYMLVRANLALDTRGAAASALARLRDRHGDSRYTEAAAGLIAEVAP